MAKSLSRRPPQAEIDPPRPSWLEEAERSIVWRVIFPLLAFCAAIGAYLWWRHG